jgi:hypothetical protein
MLPSFFSIEHASTWLTSKPWRIFPPTEGTILSAALSGKAQDQSLETCCVGNLSDLHLLKSFILNG